ncbi:MAG: TIGR00730 family Rossman fold protein [Planctomycetota bacterium]|nr:TIGR00730 family Rossman fold protein [Planctomycetota bacterium]
MPTTLSRLCVFCGAADGNRPSYRAGADRLGTEMARRGITLIYGGGSLGLMGGVADAVLQHGGQVTGVITTQLVAKEVAHKSLSKLHVVETMHQRKKMMADMADGFITLPGGLGTLDEFFEILAWAQLGIHAKPVGVLNIDGYFDGLLKFVEQMNIDGFLRINLREALRIDDDPARLIEAMSTHTPAKISPLRAEHNPV